MLHHHKLAVKIQSIVSVIKWLSSVNVWVDFKPHNFFAFLPNEAVLDWFVWILKSFLMVQISFLLVHFVGELLAINKVSSERQHTEAGIYKFWSNKEVKEST